MMQVQCTGCAQQKLVPHSCGHRHCPHCQHHESQQWLERQMKKQVPAEYFLLTFTLPAEFRALAWAHQRVVYELLMRCTWETVRTFSQNDKQLRGTPGAIAVLHTNTRQLEFHPHVHLVMPAAAVDAERRQWRSKRRRAKGGYPHNTRTRWRHHVSSINRICRSQSGLDSRSGRATCAAPLRAAPARCSDLSLIHISEPTRPY